MNTGKLLIDGAKLAADLASGKSEFALAADLAVALCDLIGPEKLRQFGALLVAHAASQIPATDMDSGNPDAPWQGP